MTKNNVQESPPAWTQEAYCPPCSEYSFCCPNWVPPPILTWPGGVPYLGNPPSRVSPILTCPGGYPTWVPLAGYPPGRVLLAGYPPSRVPPWQGTPLAGPGRVPPPPGVCPMEFWVMLQSIMGYGYPPPRWMDRHMSKHYLPIVLHTWAVNI